MSTDVSGRWTNLWRKQRIKPLKCFDVFGNSVHTINIDHYLTKCSENIILIILIGFRTNLEGYEFIRGHLWWGQCQLEIPWPNSWDRLAWQIHEQALHHLEKSASMKIMLVEDLALYCCTIFQYRHERGQIILFFSMINHIKFPSIFNSLVWVRIPRTRCFDLWCEWYHNFLRIIECRRSFPKFSNSSACSSIDASKSDLNGKIKSFPGIFTSSQIIPDFFRFNSTSSFIRYKLYPFKF